MQRILIIGLSGLILLGLWVLSIVIAYWDLSRRRRAGGEVGLWMALVILVPGIGFAAYLFYRLLGLAFSPTETPGEAPKRQTLLKRTPVEPPRSGTIAALDLVQPTLAEARPMELPHKPDKRQLARLLVISGPHEGSIFELGHLPAVIGRGPEAAISLDQDLGVSRRHAELYDQSGVLRIRDLKSTHGTQVNDFSIDDKSLVPGDCIRVGASTLQLAQEGAV